MEQLQLKFPHIADKVRCPACLSRESFRPDGNALLCTSCAQKYPVVEGIPVLIDEKKSVFRKEDFTSGRRLFFDTTRGGTRLSSVGRVLSSLGGKTGTANYRHLRELLKRGASRPRVLVLGGSIAGMGMDELLADPELEIVESDVSFGPRTQIILDAHDIPYADETFDGVIAQAVLEHVLDPFQCVAEIVRVLRPEGLVYAETPFMQQVHGGAYDFHRFTHSGHRRLFKRFDEIASGAIAGAGTAMAWSYEYLLLALFGYSRVSRLFCKGFARCTGFWLKFLDTPARWNPYSIEGASGYYFLGRKSDQTMSDEEIVRYYGQTVGRERSAR